ncbi:hypothetical protein Aab01nite_45470 [Paractinoplanes abujensis]|nr:hypothetical protein Aab01nite_45470 [Actinoplanes abujensis]
MLCLSLVAGCSGSPEEPDAGPSAPAGPGVVDCGHDIGGRPPGAGSRLILDAVVLPTARLQVSDSGDGRLFAKAGLLVRAGTAVELTVDPAAADTTIGWGSPGPEGTTIRVPACPDAVGWLAFAGGYHVPRPMCVPLIVRVNGREQRAEVRVGADCES